MAKKSTGTKIKYLGTSHIRVLEAGEDFGGRLGDPLPNRVEWNFANNHIVDADEVGLSPEAIELLLYQEADVFDSGQYEEDDPDTPTDENTIRTMSEFADVTTDKKIMPSVAQQIYLGISAAQTSDEALRQAAELTGKRKSDATSATLAGPGKTEASRTGGSVSSATTTVGGSTSGSGGDTSGSSAS